MINNKIKRRDALRALSTILTLPIFESFSSSLAWSQQTGSNGPDKLMVLYYGNGCNPSLWDFTSSLSPLNAIKSEVMQVKQVAADFGGVHTASNTSFLTGAEPVSGTLKAQKSLDWIVADANHDPTKNAQYRSMALGTGDNPKSQNEGVSMRYADRISWMRDTIQPSPIANPKWLFDEFFVKSQDRATLDKQKSILDLSLSEGKSLKPHLSSDDQKRLDQYQTSLRELEKELGLVTDVSKAISQSGYAGLQTALSGVSSASPFASPYLLNQANQHKQHCENLIHIAALAMTTGLTQSASMIMANSLNSYLFSGLAGDPFVGAATCTDANSTTDNCNQGHHGNSHQYAEANTGKFLGLIDQHMVEIFKFAHTKLKDYSILDSTILLLGSDMGHGNHGTDDLPLLLAGGGSTLKLGQIVTVAKDAQTQQQKKLSGIHLGLAKRLIKDPAKKPTIFGSHSSEISDVFNS